MSSSHRDQANVVFLGDTYDAMRPPADCVAMVQGALEEFTGAGCQAGYLLGNHDDIIATNEFLRSTVYLLNGPGCW